MPNTSAKTGNIQGFELPRGCLMTSGIIASMILTIAIAVLRADSLTVVASTGVCTVLIVVSSLAFRGNTQR